MGNFTFQVPALGNKFIDYRTQIMGNSYTWHWVRPMSQVKYLCIHHSAGPANQTPNDIARYHVKSLGWGGVGYHFIITPNGTCYYVGDLTTARAHVYNYNHLALGICLIGTFMNGQLPSKAQINSAHLLCSQLLFRTPELPGTDGWEDLVGHKQLGATACPGDSWDQYRQKIISGYDLPNDSSVRVKQISELYRLVLGREPDQAGLMHYVQSEFDLNQIRKIMIESPEHRQIIARASSLKQAQQLAAQSLVDLREASLKVAKITQTNV